MRNRHLAGMGGVRQSRTALGFRPGTSSCVAALRSPALQVKGVIEQVADLADAVRVSESIRSALSSCESSERTTASSSYVKQTARRAASGPLRTKTLPIQHSRRLLVGMRLVGIAASLGAMAIATAGACIAAGPPPTLSLRGGHTGPAGTACGIHTTWRYYHRGSTLIYSGHVQSGLTGSVTVVIERCYPPGFRIIDVQQLPPHDGRYGNTLIVHVRSDCFVQATYAGEKSQRAYFRVR